MRVQMVKPTVISTFAGCGGSSLGYHLAGFQELLAVEWDDNAVATFKLNFPDVPVYHGDIAKLTGAECMRIAGVGVGELDVFDGSPPCQGFSTAGKRKFDDPRNSLFKEYARLIQELQPKVFVMENVAGMVKGYMKQAYLEIMRTLRGCGYKAKGEVMNAMYYNVPQSRERVIVIGVREDLGIEPSHPKPKTRPVAVGDFIADDGKRFEGEMLKRWEIIPQGGNFLDLPVGLRTSAKFSNAFRKLHKNKPSFTVPKEKNFTTGTFLHWSQPRYVSLLELQRIGSFPDTFKFIGKFDDIHNRIGNSVPPNLMKAIAEHIRDNILSMIEATHA